MLWLDGNEFFKSQGGLECDYHHMCVLEAKPIILIIVLTIIIMYFQFAIYIN